ncbi:MAG: hypothetical protein PHS34_09775 [Candidatus Omnitrophica bacterium]|nr:hypothetical protein [Candidatus Omnitrophota bacterium]
MNVGYRIPKDSILCRYGKHWQEYLGERWMGSCEMFECNYDGNKETLEICAETNKCLAYEPVPTTICPKHDIEYTDYCEKCYPEAKDWY